MIEEKKMIVKLIVKMIDDMEHERKISFQSRHLGDDDGQCEE